MQRFSWPGLTQISSHPLQKIVAAGREAGRAPHSSYRSLRAAVTIPGQATPHLRQLPQYPAKLCYHTTPDAAPLFYLIAPFHALHTLQEPAISYYVIWYHTKVALYHKTFPSKAHHIMVHVHTPTIQTTPAHSLLLLALYHNNVLQWHTILDYE